MNRYRIVAAGEVGQKPKPTHAIQFGDDELVAMLFEGKHKGAHLLVDAANAFLEERDEGTGLHGRMRQLEAERAKYLEELTQLRAAQHLGGRPDGGRARVTNPPKRSS